ncbi:MAG: nucleotidyl transferase AbiEii/AbiGii toxin family protein [Elusimicrobiota bacterium]
MNETLNFIKKLISEHTKSSGIFKRNIIKEYLQILVLDFIYAHPEYSDLVFYGGSCLTHCFGLPRLSEDLDFVDSEKKIDIFQLSKDLEKFFEKETELSFSTKVQKFRIYLKFPILKELGLVSPSESDFLFLKVEIFSQFDFHRNYKTEIRPLFKFNRSILIRTFDLSTLMATKIRAILLRKWEKTDKKGKTLAKVKGRDYFDLMWYLEKGIKPNLEYLKEFKDIEELKKELIRIVEKVDSQSIIFDLENLIKDRNFVINLSKNIKGILKRDIEEKLK